MDPSLETMDIDSLRRLAVDSWQRAERLERERAQAVHEKAQAVHEKGVVQAKLDALSSENEMLLARIAQLTLVIARSQDRDVQLALELELTRLRKHLANSNDQVYGSRFERRPRDKPIREKKKKRSGPTPQPKLPVETVVCTLEDCTCSGCGGNLHTRYLPHEHLAASSQAE